MRDMKKVWLPLKNGWEVWKKCEWGGIILLVGWEVCGILGVTTATTLMQKIIQHGYHGVNKNVFIE